MSNNLKVEDDCEPCKEEKESWFETFKKIIEGPFKYDKEMIPPEPDFFTAGFLAHKEDRFVIKNRDSFFSSAQRSLIAREIMTRTRYGSENVDKLGLARLMNKGVFRSAYPLHDGSYHKQGPNGEVSARRVSLA